MPIGKLKRDGLPFLNVVATGVATAIINSRRTLEVIRLRLGGTSFTKAMMTNIKVRVNGKVLVDLSGSQLDLMNTYRGKAASANYLDIDLSDFRLNNEFDRHVGAWDLSKGIDNVSVEVTIAGATAPTLSMTLHESSPQMAQNGEAFPFAGMMTKLIRTPISIAGAVSRYPIPLPQGAQGTIIKRAYIFHTNLTKATIKEDGNVLVEPVVAENSYDQTALGLVPQAGLCVLDFVTDGAVLKALNTRHNKPVECLLDYSAADSGTLILEVLDPLDNLG